MHNPKFDKPFKTPDFVIKRWKEISDAVNGPEIAKCFRYNLTQGTSSDKAAILKDGKFVLVRKK